MQAADKQAAAIAAAESAAETVAPSPNAAVPARAAMFDAPRPWWKNAGWLCAGVGLAAHIGMLVYARNAPTPVYDFSAYETTDIDIEEVAAEEHKTTTAEIPRPTDDPNASNTGEEEQGANTANNRPQGPVGPNYGTNPVIGSEDPSASGDAGSASNAIRPHWDPSMDENAYGDPSLPDSQRFDPLKPLRGGPIGFNPESIGPGMPARTDTDPTKKVEVGKANEVLQEQLHEKDKKLGLILPAAGTVASTVRDVVWSSAVPEKSQGTIVVTLGADGSVTGVKVASMAGGTAGDWEGIAAQVKAALSAKKLNLTEEYKKGAIISINVKSKMQNPSGTDPDSPVSFGTTTTFDISDIGAKPIRQVTTQTNVVPVK